MPKNSAKSKERFLNLKSLNIWDNIIELTQFEIELILKIIYPNQLKKCRFYSTEQNIKHQIETVSKWFSPYFTTPLSEMSKYKKCDSLLLKNALNNIGYTLIQRGNDFYPNVSSKDYNIYVDIMTYNYPFRSL